jgi:hypothetical protein
MANIEQCWLSMLNGRDRDIGLVDSWTAQRKRPRCEKAGIIWAQLRGKKGPEMADRRHLVGDLPRTISVSLVGDV